LVQICGLLKIGDLQGPVQRSAGSGLVNETEPPILETALR